MATDWSAVRKHFPVLDEWVYLNTATFGPVPSVAVEAMEEHFAERNRTASLDFLSWYSRADRVRGKIARWIGGKDDDIAFAPSAGIALSWILHGLEWKPGDRILTFADEFPNNIYATTLMERHGVEVDRAPGRDAFDLPSFLGMIGPQTKLILLSAVDYAHGLRPPLAAIGEAARKAGALFVVDGTQGAGAVPLDVEEQSIDVLLCHGYKWMCSPTGAGFLYVRSDARDRMNPTAVSWRTHSGWREVNELHHGSPEVPADAAKLEGGILNFSGIFAMEAVFDLYFSIGEVDLFSRVQELSQLTQETLRRAGGKPNCDLHEHFDSPIVCAAFPDLDVSEMSAALRSQQIAVSARHGRLRVSPHFFNNQDDLAALEAGIADYRKQVS